MLHIELCPNYPLGCVDNNYPRMQLAFATFCPITQLESALIHIRNYYQSFHRFCLEEYQDTSKMMVSLPGPVSALVVPKSCAQKFPPLLWCSKLIFMTTLDLKPRPLVLSPTQKPIKAYYESLAEFEKHGFSKETSVRDAFADLLKFCARKFGIEGKWSLILEYPWTLANGNSGSIDGAMITNVGNIVGYWEAKDLGDDLKKEVQKKFKAGYPQ